MKLLKKYGTGITFIRSTQGNYKSSKAVCGDASRYNDYVQLAYLPVLLFGTLNNDSIFHNISWNLDKSRRQIKSIASADNLATGEAIDEGKVLANLFKEVIGLYIELSIAVDSKDLFDTSSICRLAIDRSARGDVGSIRFEYVTEEVSNMVWEPGRLDCADASTKQNSSLFRLSKYYLNLAYCLSFFVKLLVSILLYQQVKISKKLLELKYM